MGLSRISAMAIATNESIRSSYAGPNDEGKFTGLILIDENHRILISTKPQYGTKEEALAGMNETIEGCKEWFKKQVEAGEGWAVAIARSG